MSSIIVSDEILIVDESLSVLGTTNSSNYTTGALIVKGGIGINKDLNIGGNLTVQDLYVKNKLTLGIGLTNYSFPIQRTTNNNDKLFMNASNELIFNTLGSINNVTTTFFNNPNKAIISSSVLKDVNVSGIYVSNLNDISGVSTINVSDTSNIGEVKITNTTSGSLNVSGGVAIEKNINIGGSVSTNSLNVNGIIMLNGTLNSTSNTQGAYIVYGGVGVVKNVNIGGTIDINNTTQSTTSSNGALIVSGDTTIAKNLTVSGNYNNNGTIKINNTTNATNYTDGSLIVKGGVGIAKDLFVGGNIHVGINSIIDKQFFMGIHTIPLSVSSSTYSSLQWNTEIRKDSYFTHTVNSTNIIINNAGWYEITSDISAQVLLGDGFDRSICGIRITVNGTAIIGTNADIYSRTAEQGLGTASITTIHNFNINDILNIQINRLSGNNTITSVSNACRLLINKI